MPSANSSPSQRHHQGKPYRSAHPMPLGDLDWLIRPSNTCPSLNMSPIAAVPLAPSSRSLCPPFLTQSEINGDPTIGISAPIKEESVATEVKVKLEVDPFYSPPLPPAPAAKMSALVKPAPVARARSEQATFLTKLFNLLSTPEYQHIICWNEDGTVIRIEDPAELTRHILPIIYKQSKFQSFSRQLNIYGFMRKTSLRHTTDDIHHHDASTWAHEFLCRDSTVEDLQSVKRRVQSRPDYPLPTGRQRRMPLSRRISPLPIPAIGHSSPLSPSRATAGDVSSDSEQANSSDCDSDTDMQVDAWEPLFADAHSLQARKVRSKVPASIALPPPGMFESRMNGTLHAEQAMPGVGVEKEGCAEIGKGELQATVPMPMPSPLTSVGGPWTAPLGGSTTGGFPWMQNQVPAPGTGTISPSLLHSPGVPVAYSQPTSSFAWRPTTQMSWSDIPSQTQTSAARPDLPPHTLPYGHASHETALTNPLVSPSLGCVGAHMANLGPPLYQSTSPIGLEAPSWSQQAQHGIGLGLGLSVPGNGTCVGSWQTPIIDTYQAPMRSRTDPFAFSSASSFLNFSSTPKEGATSGPVRSPRQIRRMTLPGNPYTPRFPFPPPASFTSLIGPVRTPSIGVGVGLGAGSGSHGCTQSKSDGLAERSGSSAPDRFVLETPPPGDELLPNVTVAGDEDGLAAGTKGAGDGESFGDLRAFELSKKHDEQMEAELSWVEF